MGKTYKKNEFDKIEKFKKLKNGHRGKNSVRYLEQMYNEKDFPAISALNEDIDWYSKHKH